MNTPIKAPAAAIHEECIRIRGARVHNLKNVDLDIPRNELVVITGPSGSGKSSLALDTIFAEGQRQYIESLSVYARQFFSQMQRPDVDLIEGLQPTLCVDQRPPATNPRSTVATMTEVYDFLRLLMARAGQPLCYKCGAPIRQQTSEQIQDHLMRLPGGTKAMILAPIVRGRRGTHKDVFALIRKAGLVRVRVDGTIFDIDQVPELAPRKVHHVDAVVDRVIIRDGMRTRIGESIDLAVRQTEGLVAVCYLDPAGDDATNNGAWRDELFSTHFACPNCNISYAELEPRTFSFSSPYGACPACDGLGWREQFDPELVLPDLDLSLADGAVSPWRTLKNGPPKRFQAELERFTARNGFAWDTPLSDLKPLLVERLLHGDENKFVGLLNLLEKEFATTTSSSRQTSLAKYRSHVVCRPCQGSRLRPEATSVRLAGHAIHEITRMPVTDAMRFFSTLDVPHSDRPVAEPIVKEIRHRLAFLTKVGVDYLTLDRPADTLSGGELQRVRLATSIGSGLVGVCYVLDEPTIGLHPRDNQRLIEALKELQQLGNTLLVVEHDEAMMRAADRLIDIGPEAGGKGGEVVASGTPAAVCRQTQSVTGRYLSRELQIGVPKRRRLSKTRSMTIEGVTTNNLKNVTVRFPLGALIAVTGVSGSGKSSLVFETLTRALIRRKGGESAKPGPFKSLRGAGQIDKVIEIDQSPIGRTPRCNAATYVGAFDEIRKVFANTRKAKQLGFRSSRFSFNVKSGRCAECDGHGVKKIEMNFLPDLFVTCSECGGARFNRQTLQVAYRGKSIADVLALSVEEAGEFFANIPRIVQLLTSLQAVGLGYLQLGQPSTTLSGGEAQRIKLAAQLARADTGQTLYLLDEPTTGLHFDDIRRLLDVLAQLVDRGNTVIVIEHNLDVIKCADWVVDLGPEGGEAGGQVVACGTPEQVAEAEASYTGRYLTACLSPGA